ncbi:MAG: hypothetical protein HQM08_09645 [Candidatus Riflebacteria bacterium]|nr:hypothetical protein [Candidatus Riflebacteria bacterium]
MIHLLFAPPLAFVFILLFVFILFRFSSGLALKTTEQSFGKLEGYACGEDVRKEKARPDYTAFFPFAFFFTIMDVVTLMVATMPKITLESALMGAIYLTGAVVCMAMLFRR